MVTRKSKKEESIHLRLPNRTKAMVLDQAARNNRSIQQEVICLVAEALHTREYDIDRYV